MNWQTVIVGAIISLAFLYAAYSAWQKVRAFSSKSACGAGCGCEAKSSGKSVVQIGGTKI